MGLPGFSTTDPRTMSSAELRRWREQQGDQRHPEEAERATSRQGWTEEAQAALDAWMEVMVAADNACRVRRNGFAYRGNMELAQMLADKIGVDMEHHFHFTYEHLRYQDGCAYCERRETRESRSRVDGVSSVSRDRHGSDYSGG